MEVIVKYPNRKLYSRSLKRYVDLGYIKDMVKTNQHFLVIDKQEISGIPTPYSRSK